VRKKYILDPFKLVKLQDFRLGRGEEGLGVYNIRFRHGDVGDTIDWVDIALASCIKSLEYINYINENEPGSLPTPLGSD
jgi:hypothetical protein